MIDPRKVFTVAETIALMHEQAPQLFSDQEVNSAIEYMLNSFALCLSNALINMHREHPTRTPRDIAKLWAMESSQRVLTAFFDGQDDAGR